MSAGDSTEGLESLGGMAAEVDGANPSAEQKQATHDVQRIQSEADQGAQQWGMLMYGIGGMLQMIEPELKPIYSEERCFAWGQQAHAVAKKHGWGVPDNMPELALIGSTIGFAMPSFFMVRERIKQVREGRGPVSWLNKVGMWWRTRKARNMGAGTDEEKTNPGAGDGGKQ